MELEADHFGRFIMDEAGYDVRAASHFHMRMMGMLADGATTDEEGILDIFRTHAAPERRIEI